MSDVDVVVVGGGIAGLTCALGLRGRGLRVVVLEREGRLGGRAQSWTDSVTGDPVTIGPHIFLSTYPNFLKVLDLVGTADRVVWQRDRFITIFDGAAPVDWHLRDLPPPLHLAADFLRDRHLGAWDKLSAVPSLLFTQQLEEDDFLRLDAMTAETLLRSLGATPRLIQRHWAFTSMSIMNVPIELCSAGALFRFYGKFIGNSGFCAGFPDGGLGDLFAPGARALLEAAGIEVRAGTRVARLLERDGRLDGVELAGGERLGARWCVAAVPPHELRRLIPPEWERRGAPFDDLAAFQPCPYVSVYLWLDRKLTDLAFWARAYSPRDLNLDFYDLSNIHRGWRGRGSVIASNIIYSHRAAHFDDDEIVACTRRELAEQFPAAAAARIEHAVVNRIPMAIHCPFPGTERKRPATRTGVPGLLLAGDWIRTELPASMESAAAAGWRAAEEVLHDLGRPEKLHQRHRDTYGLAGLVRRVARLAPVKRLPMWLHRLPAPAVPAP